MKLHIKFSGGMGITYQGSVELTALPKPLTDKIDKLLSEENLSATRKQSQNSFSADTVTYELNFEKSHKKYTFDEAQASSELLDLIDTLRTHLILESQ